MHFATVFILGAAIVSTSASLVRRQTLPACYNTCVAAANLDGCSVSDTKCLCTNAAFIASTTACIESTCHGSDLTNAIADAQEICAAVGVTLTSTPTVSSATSSASGSSGTSTAAAAGSTTSLGSSTPTQASASGGSSALSSTAPNVATTSTAAAAAHGANAFIGLAAVGLVALAL